MRKADYLTLAQVVRAVREHNTDPATGRDLKPDAVMAAENIAREFARLASVDREAFLKACGVT